jgi:hypothetical protein
MLLSKFRCRADFPSFGAQQAIVNCVSRCGKSCRTSISTTSKRGSRYFDLYPGRRAPQNLVPGVTHDLENSG